MISNQPGTTMGLDGEAEAHTDLDHLAGTWSKEEAKAFELRAEVFEVVDEELWR